ncbi:hypothetical protein [Aneurinibacillus terranovensis]|uniref:hypothetical protein n=1 Tax=Aneurinibacillus terranovensis TaxID=278991 RepID=UPI0004052E2C|nr:hypothetical protein [Aneurinibacillus terranovensis]
MMSFANWDEIVETCISCSIKTSADLRPQSLSEERTSSMRKERKATSHSYQEENQWMDDTYDNMLAHKYGIDAYTSLLST